MVQGPGDGDLGLRVEGQRLWFRVYVIGFRA
jgi:hypothetical protein